jgi:hypothetical protein
MSTDPEPLDLESFLTHVDLSVKVQPWQLPFFELMERMRPEDRMVIRHGRKRSWLEVGKGSWSRHGANLLQPRVS